MALRYGFKAEAERLATDMRAELGVGTCGRLNPCELADLLAVPVISLRDLAAKVDQDVSLLEAVELLSGPETSALSAVTVFAGTRRLIVHNEAHSQGRQASNLTHELGHGLLLHPAVPALDHRGCRNWNADIEEEATFLAGALLIPVRAAWRIAKQQLPFDQAAEQYGCSEDMVRWRVNITGARRLLLAG